MQEPIGITFYHDDNEDPLPVYLSDDGIDAFEIDGPYLLTDGLSLVDPVPVVLVGGSDSDGPSLILDFQNEEYLAGAASSGGPYYDAAGNLLSPAPISLSTSRI